MNKISRRVVASLFAVSIGMSVASCTSDSVAEDNRPKQPATAAGAKATMDSFFDQVKIDTADYTAKVVDKKTDDEKDALFMEEFSDSLAYVKKDAFPDDSAKEVAGSFASLFIIDPEATIESEESDYVVDGESAVVKGSSFDLTINGEQQTATEESAESGSLTLTFEDDKWRISKFDLG